MKFENQSQILMIGGFMKLEYLDLMLCFNYLKNNLNSLKQNAITFNTPTQKIAQCKDQTLYPANWQTCIPCSPTCLSGEYCDIGNTCICKPNFQCVTG